MPLTKWAPHRLSAESDANKTRSKSARLLPSPLPVMLIKQNAYELIQAYIAPKVWSAMNAAWNSYSNVIFCIYWPPCTVEEGDKAGFFVQGPYLVLLIVTKTCLHPPQAFEKLNNGQAFRTNNSLFFPPFFLTSRLQVLEGMPIKHFNQIRGIRRSECVGSSSHTWHPKLIPYWNLVIST